MGNRLLYKFKLVTIALIIVVSTSSPFPFRNDNGASITKAATLMNTISIRDDQKTASNDLVTGDNYSLVDESGGSSSSIGLTAADQNNQQQQQPVHPDGLFNLEIPDSSSGRAGSSVANFPAAGTSDMASRRHCAGEAKQVEKRVNVMDGSTIAGGGMNGVFASSQLSEILV